MQIVIEIDERSYNLICKFIAGEGYNVLPNYITDRLFKEVVRGTPLPKGHGRLKDVDKIDWYGCTSEDDCPYKNRDCKDCDKAECSKTQVDGIPVLISADKEVD